MQQLGRSKALLTSSEELGLKLLTSGHCVIGAQFLQPELRDQAAFTGFALQEALLFVNRSMQKVLQLGLGAAVVPNFLRDHGLKAGEAAIWAWKSQVDVVEMSPIVARMAEAHFGASMWSKIV